MYFSLDGSSWKACLKSAAMALIGALAGLFTIWGFFFLLEKLQTK
jgi:hypothetical protein